ncbi:hypothetical protein [uncultured Clostridium sp.]|nr:hypothetical protein [uncultured Clostridium sp.]
MKIIVELYILICDDCKKEFTIKKKNIKTEKLFNMSLEHYIKRE